MDNIDQATWWQAEGFAHDPIIQQADGWYFYDESWANLIGPFDTWECAKIALDEYAESLETVQP